ncbi:retinol dehydrogenase 7-like [Corythoichthys intestinalis]|uniref:retinol dehydrogenase 7-like n=1 Tax=Corythoichthys intestinalis TaxID=161448 RepID=UPI0025A63937|nr:retinol dehydrogenase 7-like [Corythoichthys intestinalis]XP_061799317.1 retinol dehydrogenase 7-like [Nerophis lumbriciformis]
MFLYILVVLAVWLVYRWFQESKRVGHNGDKFVYITGCDTGFGHLLAKHLDKLGFHVIAGCYTEKGEDELKKSSSCKLTTLRLDVSDSASVRQATVQIDALVGQKGLWAVVNNAGISEPAAPTDWLTVEDYKRMIAVNLVGVIDVTLSVLPLIKKARGRVVNIASVFGRISPFGGPYCVTKHGVEAFNDSLRLNLAPFGVKVLCIEPGFFKTNVTNPELLEKNGRRVWERLPQKVKDDYGPDYVQNAIKTFLAACTFLSDGDLMKVINCMEHAIAAVHPRTRYSPGWDAKFLWLPLSYVPTFITDGLISKLSPRIHASVY